MTLPPISPPLRNAGRMSALLAFFTRRKQPAAIKRREAVIAGHLTEFSALVDAGQRDAALTKWAQLRNEPMIRIAMSARLRANGVGIEPFMKPARTRTMGEARRERTVVELVADLAS